MKKVNGSNLKNETGVSLIEVLVALFVLAIGLLGVIALQAETVKLNQQSYGSTQAMFVANDAAERMRVNILPYVNGLNGREVANPVLANVMSGDSYALWQEQVATLVPGGVGRIEKVGGTGRDFKISVTYTYDVLENEKNSDAEANKKEFEYVLYTTL